MNFEKNLISFKHDIRDALNKLNTLGVDAILFVVNDNNELIGSLTDGDVRRGLLKGFLIDDKVVKIIQPNPKFIRKGERDLAKVIALRENNFKIIPVLASDSDKIVNIINFRLLKSYLPIDAIIMAGGKGMRLRPLTEQTPKPLLKIGEKTIIDYNFDRLASFGIDDFWISINYLGEKIKTHFKEKSTEGLEIDYVSEPKPLGTVGSVANIPNLSHDVILVTNSDLLTNLDYEKFYLDFIEKKADFSVIGIPYNVEIPYAILETEERNVIGFKEKPTYTFLSNGGIYLMKKEFVNLIPKDTFYDITDLMDKLIELDKKIVTFPHNGYWLDIGKMDDFKKAQNDIQNITF